MPKVFTSEKQKIGQMGEKIAEQFLVKRDFSVLDRNYTKKWGELDLVTQKDNKIYFVEVKTMCKSFDDINKNILGEAGNESDSEYRAEDNMHPWKLKRLSRAVQTYLLENNIDDETEWQLDLVVVYLDIKTGEGTVKVVSDIIL